MNSSKAQKPQPTPYTADLTSQEAAPLVTALAGLGDDAVRLVIHVAESVRRHPNAPGGWIELPASFLKKHYRGVDISAILGRGALQCDYSFVRGVRSRRYRIAPAFAEQLALAAAASVTARAISADATTGRRLQVRRTPRRDKNEKLHPSVVLGGLDGLSPCRFDRDATEDAVLALAVHAAGVMDPETRALAFTRAWTHARSYGAVVRQRPREVAPKQWEYSAAYTVQKTGRIGERGGGLQSVSQWIRAAAFRSVGARNFDIVASHPAATASWMADLGMDTVWLRRWVDERPWRDVLAAEVGLEVDVLKAGLMALLLGAPFPSLQQARNRRVRSTLSLALRAAAEEDVLGAGRVVLDDRLADVHDRAWAALGPLTREVRPWLDHVESEYLSARAPGLERRGGLAFVRNQCGMLFYPAAPHLAGRKRLPLLLAHLLQGAEAAVVHRITAAASSHGFRVLLNLHDGFVALGDVPDTVIAAAFQETGLHGVRLAEKPFDAVSVDTH